MREQPKNMNTYSLEDIERYLQGKLSPAEMHELEKAAVQDPFLADAIEGYQSSNLAIVKEDLAEIHAQLSSGPAKIISANAKKNTWWRVAAALLLLAGAGILGSKLFIAKNDNKELAIQQPVSASQTDSVQSAADVTMKEVAAAAVQKNDLLAKNNEQVRSLKKNMAADNSVSLDIANAKPVASLPVSKLNYDDQHIKPDTVLFDKTGKDILAANTFGTRSTALSAQAKPGAQLDGFLKRNVDPAVAREREQINTILTNGNLVKGNRDISVTAASVKAKKNRKDTIKLETDDMPVFSRAGYLKPDQSAITSIGSLSLLTATGSVMPKKRSSISFDTVVLTDQKQMTITLSDVSATPSAAPRLEVSKPKKDTDEVLAETVITGYGSANKTAGKGLNRSKTIAPETNLKKELGSGVRETFSVAPVGGWLDFRSYVSGKIADETGTRHGTGQHGSVKVKMNISEKGKASKVTIEESFNTRFNAIIIKAIQKRQRWVSSDHLAKKEYVFVIVF